MCAVQHAHYATQCSQDEYVVLESRAVHISRLAPRCRPENILHFICNNTKLTNTSIEGYERGYHKGGEPWTYCIVIMKTMEDAHIVVRKCDERKLDGQKLMVKIDKDGVRMRQSQLATFEEHVQLSSTKNAAAIDPEADSSGNNREDEEKNKTQETEIIEKANSDRTAEGTPPSNRKWLGRLFSLE